MPSIHSIKSKPFVEIVKSRGANGYPDWSELREATPEDIEHDRMFHEIGQCPHNVVYDESGWPYDFRACYTCGKGLGVV